MASSVDVSVVPAQSVQAEGLTGTKVYTFAVTRSGDLGALQTVEWIVTGDGAHGANGLDFGGSTPAGTVTFGPGETSKALTILATGDITVEFDEDFSVTLFNPSSGLVVGVGSASATIVNDDAAVVSIAAGTATMLEGDSRTTPLTFVINLDRPAVTAQSVVWSVSGSGAHSADALDFVGPFAAGGVTFAPGELSTTIFVDVAGDTGVEFDEGFTVTLSNASSGLAIGTATASGTILNDDKPLASIRALSASKAEGSGGTTAFTFEVTLDRPSVSGQTIGWSVAGAGSYAADAADFGGALPTGSVSFAPGETSKVATVLVSADSAVEFDEGFAVTLSNASSGVEVVTASASATIGNDDKSVVSVAAQSATAAEGTGIFSPVMFLVTLDRPGVAGQTVRWSVKGSGAQPADAVDFGGMLPSGFAVFAAGETSKLVTVWVSGDGIVELDEGLTLALSTMTSDVALGNATASATILDDDRSVVSIAATSAQRAEGNVGATSFFFTLTRAGDSSVAQSVAYAVTGSGDHPVNAADFVGGMLPAGTVSLAIGETTKTLVVEIAGDRAVGADEGFSVTLSNPSNNLQIGTGTASSVVVNDDMDAHDDAYVLLQGQALHIAAPAGVLTNDEGTVPTTAAVLTGPAHGTLTLSANGGFDYQPTAGFVGADSFTYRATGANGSGDAEVIIHVAPLSASQTLALSGLTHEQQIGALYTGFLGRAADADGFGYWLDKSQSMPLASIARAFGVSDEAMALHAFLADPQGADDAAIGTFLDAVYDNLFGRIADAAGVAYWTGQIKQAVEAGKAVAEIVIGIVGGAQNSAAGQDVTTLMSKVAVNLEYAHEREGTPWSSASDSAYARALLDAVTADPQTVLVGIANADRGHLGEG